MRYRKVQEVGKGTLIISLPKAWARRYGVKKGSIIAVNETAQGQLILEPVEVGGREEGPLHVVIECDRKTPQQLEWDIIGAYLLGYDAIELASRERMSSEVKTAIRRAVRSLAGLEIVDEDSKHVLINCLVDPAAVAPKRLLVRKNAITISMHSDAVAALVNGDRALAELVVDRDEEVDRLYFLLVRLLRTAIRDPKLAKRFSLSPVDCLDFRMAAKLIESIGDHAVDMALLVGKLPRGSNLGALSEEISEAENSLRELQDTAIRAFLARREQLVDQVKGILEARFLRALEAIEGTAERLGSLSPLAFSLASLMNEIAKCCIDIVDLVIPAGLEIGLKSS